MAANYWTSTQYRLWHFTPSQLSTIRAELQSQNANSVAQFPISDHRHVLIFLKDQLLRLSRRLQSRQQCLATTLVYIHRYLLTHPIQTVNPYLLLTTAFYLASKTEESPNHIRVVLGEARQFWPEFVRADVARIGEMEFSIISELRSQLIVWHPYRTLLDLKVAEKEGGLGLNNDEVGLAWSIINDSYLTDLPLTCAPHTIAIMAIFLAVAFQPANKAASAQSSQPTFQLPNAPSPTPSPTPGGPNQNSLQGLVGRQVIPSALGNSVMNRTNNQSRTNTNTNNNNNNNNTTTSTETKPQPTPPTGKMQNMIHFLAESSIDLQQVIDATQHIISLYEAWESYSEKTVKEALSRVIRGRGMA